MNLDNLRNTGIRKLREKELQELNNVLDESYGEVKIVEGYVIYRSTYILVLKHEDWVNIRSAWNEDAKRCVNDNMPFDPSPVFGCGIDFYFNSNAPRDLKLRCYNEELEYMSNKKFRRVFKELVKKYKMI